MYYSIYKDTKHDNLVLMVNWRLRDVIRDRELFVTNEGLMNQLGE
jgi:hypothetical protein